MWLFFIRHYCYKMKEIRVFIIGHVNSYLKFWWETKYQKSYEKHATLPDLKKKTTPNPSSVIIFESTGQKLTPVIEMTS